MLSLNDMSKDLSVKVRIYWVGSRINLFWGWFRKVTSHRSTKQKAFTKLKIKLNSPVFCVWWFDLIQSNDSFLERKCITPSMHVSMHVSMHTSVSPYVYIRIYMPIVHKWSANFNMLSSVCAQSVVRASAKECSFTYYKTLPGAVGHLVTFILQDMTYQLECSAKARCDFCCYGFKIAGFNFQRQGFNNWNWKKGLNCCFTFGLEKSVREEDKI